jgi:hypothetical protein
MKPTTRRPLRPNSQPNIETPPAQQRKFSIKKTLPTPTKFSDFISMIILYVFKKFVFAPIHVKIGLYFIGLIFFSVLKDFQYVPFSYFKLRENVFNVYFVKYAWIWTVMFTFPFIFMTSCVYTAANSFSIRCHASRILISTAIWYLCTSLFDYVSSKTGRCSQGLFTKNICKFNGYRWINSFEFSDQTFLLMHCLFFIIEEAKAFCKWDKIKEDIFKHDESTSSQNSIENMKKIKRWFNIFSPYIKINFILLAFLTLLCEVMLISTFLYYQTIIQKILSAFVSVIIWFLTYRCFYPNEKLPFNPGAPGVGVI